MCAQDSSPQVNQVVATSAPASTTDIAEDITEDVRGLDDTLRLISGETVRVRAIRPDDTARLQAFHAHLSTDSIVYRFFRFLPTLPLADAEHFTHVDYRDRMALVAVSPGTASANGEEQAGQDDEMILGVVRYDRISPSGAEVAFVVEDHWQGHGIATALLHRLAAYARARGFTEFLAITMATNARMLEVLRHAGYPLTIQHRGGEADVTLDITQPATGEPAPGATGRGGAH